MNHHNLMISNLMSKLSEEQWNHEMTSNRLHQSITRANRKYRSEKKVNENLEKKLKEAEKSIKFLKGEMMEEDDENEMETNSDEMSQNKSCDVFKISKWKKRNAEDRMRFNRRTKQFKDQHDRDSLKIRELTDQNLKLSGEINQKKVEFEMEIQIAKEQIQNLENKIENHQSAVTSLQIQQLKNQIELTSSQKVEIDNLKALNQSLTEILEKEIQNNASDVSNKNYIQKIRDLEKQIETQRSADSLKLRQLQNQQQLISSQKKEIENMKTQNRILSENFEKELRKATEISDRLQGAFDASNTNYIQKIRDLEKSIKVQRSTDSSKIQHLQEKIQQFSENLLEKESDIEQLKEALVQKEYTQENQETDKLKEKLDLKNVKIQGLKKDLEEIEKELEMSRDLQELLNIEVKNLRNNQHIQKMNVETQMAREMIQAQNLEIAGLRAQIDVRMESWNRMGYGMAYRPL